MNGQAVENFLPVITVIATSEYLNLNASKRPPLDWMVFSARPQAGLRRLQQAHKIQGLILNTMHVDYCGTDPGQKR